MSACRTCGAPIIWATVRKSGKRMPLDATPDPDGNVALRADGTCEVWGATIRLSLDEAVIAERGATWHRAHFAVCPNADRHRTRR